MLATLALSLVCSIDAVTRFLVFVHEWRDHETLGAALLPMLIFLLGGSFGIVIGGAIVRQCRLRSFRAASS